jgi:SAM-dependent methyltransferase
MASPDHVARYYDRNTSRFLRFGGGSSALAIHRELWGPGVTTATEAKRYVNRILADEIPNDAEAVLDLGCGVGGTMFDLASRFPTATLHGVTLSPRQVQLAEGFAKERGLADRCHFHLGDFESLRLEAEQGAPLRANAVLSIEAFAHAADPEAFFATARRHLDGPRGRVIVVDDFLTRDPSILPARQQGLVETFRSGWRLGSLVTAQECAAAARPSGFELVANRDLTPLIRPGRPRDRVIARFAPIFARLGLVRLPFFSNMIGGDALQRGIREGVFEYRMLVFGAIGT